MLGKVLRQPELNPALSSFIFAPEMINSKKFKGRKGRHRKKSL
jgi:hypothetical protein